MPITVTPTNRFSTMPPQRIRNGFEDSRSEASSTRDKQNAYMGISKARRNGTSTLAGSNLKDVTNVETNQSGQQGDAAVSVGIWYVAGDSVISLIATRIDRLAVFRYFCATCLSPRASSRHPTSLCFVIQPKDAYKAGHWTVFTHNGTATCAPTYRQRRSSAGCEKGLQCCNSP